MAPMVETDAKSLGASLPVPSVKQLAEENLAVLPSRYIRDDIEPPALAEPFSGADVPVIDMQKLLFEDSGESELCKLHFACKDWGFFHLTNHGMDSSLVEKAKQEVQDLFNLPLEVKKNKYGQVEGEVEGYGQAFVVSEEQKLDWADMFYIQTLPLQMRSSRLFSNLSNSFSPHYDAVGLTILLQANETQGLEIKKDGKWIPIVSIPNSFIVNVGDCVEIFTNGIYPSIEHRGVVNREKERISIATFHSPKLDGELGPANSLITPQTPAKFKRVSVVDYYRLFYARKLDGKSHAHAFRIDN